MDPLASGTVPDLWICRGNLWKVCCWGDLGTLTSPFPRRSSPCMRPQAFDQRPKLPRAVEIDVVLQIVDNDACWRTARERVEEPFQCADRKVAECRVSNRLALSHLEVAGELIEQDQHLVIAKHCGPFVYTGRSGAIAPKRSHDIALTKLLGDITPEKAFGVLMTVEDHDLGRFEFGAAR